MASVMNDFDVTLYMDAAAAALGLTIEPAWRAEVADNLKLLFLQGERLLDFPLPDEAEAAPVFSL
jgi:hypothetical protein